MKNHLLVSFFLFLIIFGCASSKIDRTLKRKSKIIQDSEIITEAISGGNTFAGMILYLRKHSVFDFHYGGIIWNYYAGTWEIQNDTLYLDYFYNHKPLFLSEKAYCDTINNKFVFEQKYKIGKSFSMQFYKK